MKGQPVYKRILLKLGGESFSGEEKIGIDIERVKFISAELAEIKQMDIQIAIVIGGGNIFRGEKPSRKVSIKLLLIIWGC